MNILPSQFEIRLTSALNKVTEKIHEIESDEKFRENYLFLDPNLTKSRSFHSVVFDGLLAAYADMTCKLDLDEVPLEPYRQILAMRYQMPASPEDARAELLDDRDQEFDPAPVFAPEFVTIFQDTPPLSVLEVMPLWKEAVTCMADVLESDTSHDIRHRMQMYLKKTTSNFEKNYSQVENALQKNKEARTGPYTIDQLNKLWFRAEELNLSPSALKRLTNDFSRMDKMQENSGEYNSAIKPLMMILNLPWGKRTGQNYSIAETESRMNERHFGMGKIKTVIAEHIAVQRRTGKSSGKILCLDGAPGIGKTSLAETIAHATGRKLVRIALGGVNDVVDIRGHSSTYLNAQSGRIAKAMVEAGVTNPILLLDEIDKVSSRNGNVSEVADALLEALDPEQNKRFKDTFLDIEYDLSEVMFIATSNDKSKIPPALLDRMEVVNLPGYTVAEKLEIAQRHLLPRQREKTGVTESDMTLTQDALRKMIDDYVSEPGVRQLDRLIEKLCRKAAYELETTEALSVKIDSDDLNEYLGKSYADKRRTSHPDAVGVVNGLAVSGGTTGVLLPFEAVSYPGNGFAIRSTGQMGTTMKESIEVVTAWLKANASKYEGLEEAMKNVNLHIDGPDDNKKDGPSAGAALTALCLSVLTNKPLRGDVGMTGKMSLTGRILAIGGTIAKLEGAMKAGLTTVLIPQGNADDLTDASEDIKKTLKIIPVATIDDVLKYAFRESLKRPTLSLNHVAAGTTSDTPLPVPVIPPEPVPAERRLPAPSVPSPSVS